MGDYKSSKRCWIFIDKYSISAKDLVAQAGTLSAEIKK